MGAACSSSVDLKYRNLKQYFKNSPCLTFTHVIGFLPSIQANYPPMILIGERHDWNESVNHKKRCATIFEAMNRTVSVCHQPTSKIVFLVEVEPKNLEVFPAEMENYSRDFTSTLAKSTRYERDFSLLREYYRSQMAYRYSSGIQLIPVGIFDRSRRRVQSNLQSEEMLFGFNVKDIQVEIIQAFQFTVKDILPKDKLLHLVNNQLNPIFDVVTRNNDLHVATNYVKYAQVVSANINLLMSIVTARWIALFTSTYIESKKTNNDPDLTRIQLEVNSVISKICTDPKDTLLEIFDLLVLCGDALAYIFFVKPRMKISKQNSEVLVFYNGARHTLHFTRWLSYGGYTEDFKRVAFEKEGTFPENDSTRNIEFERSGDISNNTMSDLRKLPQKRGFDSI